MSLSHQIEEKINIVDLVGRYIAIKKAWTNYKALCPFHSEKTPSFIISPAKNIAYCFSCHNGWWPIKFLSEIEKIPFWEAVHKLAKEVWIELKTDYYKEKKEDTGDIYDIYKITADFYHQELFRQENKDKLDYLLKREITLETIKTFQLWYSWDSKLLFEKLKSRWFQEKDILNSWIFVSNFKDKFLWRIVFPIANFTGNIVAFTGRVLDNSLPKYLNSPASKIFDKSSILFWLNLAKQEISKKDFVIIVEWQMDVISLHQAGFLNTVAISGTALTSQQIALLKRLTKNIYLCLDNDDAGINATFSSIENTLNENIDIKIINLDKFKDPDELIKSWEKFDKFIEKSLSQVEFYIKRWEKKYNLTTIQWKKSLVKDLIKMLKRVNSSIEVDIHLKEISKKLDISLDVLYSEFKQLKSDDTEIIKQNNKKNKWFEFYEIIGWYLILYNFFNLFLENFKYNVEDLEKIDTTWTLIRILKDKDLFFEDENIDRDKFKSIELFIESENELLNKEKIEKKFIDLVKNLSKSIFDSEKKILDEALKKNSKDINLMKQYNNLIKKGKEMGIR